MISQTWADSLNPVTVEIYYSAGWHDISAYLGATGLQITRGRQQWEGTASPAEATMTLDNSDGRFSARNPLSPLYGLIGRGTPIRIKVTTNAVTYTRFYGEVVSWPAKWNRKGIAYVPVQCAGVTRRLGTGVSPLKSAYYRGCTSPVAPVTGLRAYWPCEDTAGSAVLATGLPGKAPMTYTGAPALASDETSFPCSAPLPVIDGGTFRGVVPDYGSTGQIQVRYLLSVPAAGTTNGAVLMSVRTGGSAARWELVYSTGGSVALNAYNYAGTALLTTAAYALGLNGSPIRLDLELTQSGANVTYTFSVLQPGATVGTYVSASLASQTVGACQSVTISPGANMTGCTVGHVTVQSAVTSVFDLDDMLAGYRGELAGYRFERLAAEEGLAYTTTGTKTLTPAMGVQGRSTLLDLLGECENTDLGMLSEPRAAAGLAYRARESVTAQAAALTIAYVENMISLEPAPDDHLSRNRVTITRASGSSWTSEVTTGAMSTAAPPSGIGIYDESVTLSLAYDTQTRDQATWRTHLGTVDEDRWPTLGFDLAHPVLRASAATTATVLGLDLGDRVVITGLPSWLPPDAVDQVITGYTETISPEHYQIVYSATPYTPYRVGVWDDSGSRYSGEGTVLAADITSTATSITVTAPAGITWSVADGSIVIAAGGETMTLTAVTGTAPNYNFTVVRSANGIVKSHLFGAAIDVYAPVYYGF